MKVETRRLEELFSRVDSLRVGVIGDFCLDAYWHADMRRSELSRETPHHPLPIIRERMQPGGAGNVACNLAALRPMQVTALSVVGNDWRGAALMQLLRESGVETAGLLQTMERVTNAYIKPMRHGIAGTVYEDPRLDFENHEPLCVQWEERLLEKLDQAAPSLHALCVCDQMQFGCITPKIRERLGQLGAAGLLIFVDSRDRIAQYQNVITKPNEVELCRAMGEGVTTDMAALELLTRRLHAKTERSLLVTLGERGCMTLESGEITHIPAYPVQPPVDICGAGDTFLAAASLLYAAGASLAEGARYAACSASLTVKKIAETGVTTREELLRCVAQNAQRD